MDIGRILYDLSMIAVPVILAITFHEAAHGFVAWKLGDDTAWQLGRVSFNPIRHIDPVGTVILPALMYFTTPFVFGWAKPVPVNFARLGNPKRDMVWVALAGPAINIVLALLSAFLVPAMAGLPQPAYSWAVRALLTSVEINVVLAVFNMLPIPPLDGGRVAVGLLPRPLAIRLAGMEREGMALLMLVFLILPAVGSQIGAELDLFSTLVAPVAGGIANGICALAGVHTRFGGY
ncbi:MAG: site-2 protease family protein [Rhodospirillaceae bacterium]